MQSTQLMIILMSAVAANGQRPSFAGTRPIGFPELYDLTTKADELGNRFGEGNVSTTTQRLPLEALGDKNLVERLSKLPVDSQPFWFINWQALEAQRKNPQSYPQKPNSFVPIEGSFGTQNQNSNPVPNSNGGAPSVNSRVSDSVTGTPSTTGVRTTEAVFGYADSEIGRVEDYNKGSGNTNAGGVGNVATSENSGQTNDGLGNTWTPNKNTVNFGAPLSGLGNVGYSNDPNMGTPFDHTTNTQSGFGTPLFNSGKPNSGIGNSNNLNPNSGLANFSPNNVVIPNISSGPVKTSTIDVIPLKVNHVTSAETVGAPKVNNVVYNSMIKLHNEEQGEHGLPPNKSFNNHDSTLEVQRTDNPDKSWSNNWKYTWMNTYGYENHFTIPPQPIQLNGGR